MISPEGLIFSCIAEEEMAPIRLGSSNTTAYFEAELSGRVAQSGWAQMAGKSSWGDSIVVLHLAFKRVLITDVSRRVSVLFSAT